ncbi:MAG: PQQ-binding-like beta-propeller repeat protein [Thermoplasmata archaeon]|nr:PQQ-binding-like beta-propeller repeat protein [Thermoplasmata archaeon]
MGSARRSRVSWIILILLMSLLPLSSISADEGWTSFRGDKENSGYRNETLCNGSLALLWEAKADSSITSSFSAGPWGVLFGTVNGTLYNLDPGTGDLLWTHRMGGPIEATPTYSPDTGLIIAADNTGMVKAIHATNGTVKWVWQSGTGGDIRSSPLVADGRVVFGSYDDSVYCLDELTGERQWKFIGCSGWVHTSPSYHDGNIFFGSCDGLLRCVDVLNGREIWSFQADYIPSSPAVSNAKVYFGSYDGHLYCLDADTGDMYWNRSLGDGISSSPAVDGDVVVVGCDNGIVYCFDALNGAPIWEWNMGAAKVGSSPLLLDDMVLVTHDQGLVILNRTDGSVNRSFEMGDTDGTSPAYYDGSIFFGDTNGYVRRIGAEDVNDEPGEEDEPDPGRLGLLFAVLALKTIIYVSIAIIILLAMRKMRRSR